MKKIDNIKTLPVESSNIAEVGHNKETNTLQVKFTGKGSIYQYNPVTEEAYKAMVGAESIGKWFNENIKTNQSVECIKIN